MRRTLICKAFAQYSISSCNSSMVLALLACFFHAAMTAALDCNEFRASRVDYNRWVRIQEQQANVLDRLHRHQEGEKSEKGAHLVVRPIPRACGAHPLVEWDVLGRKTNETRSRRRGVGVGSCRRTSKAQARPRNRALQHATAEKDFKAELRATTKTVVEPQNTYRKKQKLGRRIGRLRGEPAREGTAQGTTQILTPVGFETRYLRHHTCFGPPHSRLHILL